MAIDPKAVGATTEPIVFDWTDRDTLLYALGVGAGLDDLKFTTGYNIEPVVASEPSIREAIDRYYAEKGPSLDEILGQAYEQVDVHEQEEEEVDIEVIPPADAPEPAKVGATADSGDGDTAEDDPSE